MQLVIAGKAHPADDGGKELVQEIVRFADQADVRHRIVFLPDYDIGMARYLYGGCDVWLNNPLRPLEACGTSGMKSALNGGLNLSILDGWWDEMYDGENGWAIPTADGVTDPDRRDDLEAAAFYELVEKQVRTRFYDVDGGGVPQRWVDMVRHTLQTLGPKVLASRMVRDYVHELYTPASRSAQVLAAKDFAQGQGAGRLAQPGDRQLVAGAGAARRERQRRRHPARWGRRCSSAPPSTWASSARRTSSCRPSTDGSTSTTCVHRPVYIPLAFAGQGDDGLLRFEGEVPLSRAGSYGYTVRVLPHHDLLPTDAELGLLAEA